MNKKEYKIIQENNFVKLFDDLNKEPLFSSFWFKEFGKNSSEIYDANENLLYNVSKKFQFWKWKMVYLIKDHNQQEFTLSSQNAKNTVFKIELNSDIYKTEVHYKKRTSIYKNDKKIAEIDESFTDDNYEKAIKLSLLKEEKLKIPFLLITCLLIGEVELHHKKVVMKSQKELEKNNEPWS